MSSNLIKLLATTVVAIFLGYVCYPLGGMVAGLFRMHDEKVAEANRAAQEQHHERLRRLVEARKAIEKINEERRQPVVIEDDTAGDDWDVGFNDSEDDETAVTDATNFIEDVDDSSGFADSASFMLGDVSAKLFGITEDPDAAEVPGQTDVVPAPINSAARTSLFAAGKKLERLLESAGKKAVKEPYRANDLSPNDWKNPGDIYNTIIQRMMAKLGKKPTTDTIIKFLEDPQNRLDLARFMLIRRASVKGISEVAERRMGTAMLAALGSDLNWLTNTMYSGPTDRMDQALRNLASIYMRYSEDMSNDVVRRIATTTAMEFARERWPEKAMIERFDFYYTSYRDGKLNKLFDTLAYWETRLVTGNREYGGWGSPQSLAWQRDNVRLPLEGYLGASGQLVYRLRNVAGDSVFSREYLAPFVKATNAPSALAHREIGGVCGACSHFGAYGALASGLPAMTMGEPGHCAYTVRVGNQWRKGYSIYWQHSMHKTFWGLHDWEFLILTQELYENTYRTLAADQLSAMGELLAARRMTPAAMNCFDAALVLQPLDWPVWLTYAGYLAQKGKTNKARWKELSERVTNTLGDKYHDAAATLQARYVYPQLLPLLPDLKERNRLYADFFKKCKTYGIHTWDVSPLLDAQLAGCPTDKEKINFMKVVLPNLLGKPAYSGAVLAWGLNVVSKMDGKPDGPQLQEEFSKIIMNSMKRMRANKKDRDATWGGLGEAINTAAENGDTRTFQAIGKLAMSKCKDHFPKHRFKFKPFRGKVVSAKGLITTATTLDGNGVKQSCLHWGVLQKTGGNIPIKFEGKSGIVVKMEEVNDLNGVVILFGGNIKNDRPFYLESSEDGRNWSGVSARAQIEGKTMRFDLKDKNASGRFLRLLREGDKWDSGSIIGFYVYGNPRKS